MIHSDTVCCWGSHIYQCVVRTNMPLSILQKLNIYWPTKSLLTVPFGYSFGLVVVFVWISFIKSLYLMFILLLLFYLPSIYKTPLQGHFAPHCTLLYCVALVILYKMKSDNIFTTKQFLLLLHNKHDYSRKNQLCRKCWQHSSQPNLAPPLDIKQSMLVTKIFPLMTKNNL